MIGIVSITIEDPATPDIVNMLEMHLADMRATSPPECVHALDIKALKDPGITFFCARCNGELLGGGALKELTPKHAEIKSMRTSEQARRKGVASGLLQHLLNEGKRRGYNHISLETGTQSFFLPAHQLYKKFGFQECPPFAKYSLNPHSVFFEKWL